MFTQRVRDVFTYPSHNLCSLTTVSFAQCFLQSAGTALGGKRETEAYLG